MLRIAGSTPHHVRDTIMRFFTASRVNVENVDAQNLENQSAGIISSGTGNEGVGEHVRIRFHLGSRSPVKLRT
jgi:hypothetical protein